MAILSPIVRITSPHCRRSLEPRRCPPSGVMTLPGQHHLSTHARGYDRRHQAERERWRPKVDAGLVDCWRCGHPIEPGRDWDLGHDDTDRTTYQGPEHRTCNRRAGGRNGAAVTHARGAQTSRDW